MTSEAEAREKSLCHLKNRGSRADTFNMLSTIRSRFPASSEALGTGRAWIAAAALVLIGATVAGIWLDQTADDADLDRLRRGADAIGHNVETEIQTLAMVSTGAEALFSGAETPEELSSLMMAVDTSVLNSLVALVSYPVTDDGVAGGDLVVGIRTWEDIVVPDLVLSKAELDQILAENPAHISAAYTEDGKDGVRMVALLPVTNGDQTSMVGAIFLIDRMLERAVAGVGDGEYAATLIDTRFDAEIVTSTGSPNSDLSIRIAPTGLAGLLVVDVAPGSAFHFAASAWVLVVSVGVGVTVALLLLGMAALTKARTREMDRRLQHSQEQHESRDRFLATVSHELRTPLTVVMGVASEMNDQWETMAADERYELFVMISEQAEEASNIVDDLLVAARSEYGSVQIAMTDTHLREHLRYAAELLPHSRRGAFTMTSENPLVCADPTRLRQILRNLLQNAALHGGPNIAVSVLQHDDTIQVSVMDDGPGVPTEARERVFEQYTQANGNPGAVMQGVGIGLYVSRLLARLMGGDLIYLRTNDQTEFRLTLRVPSRVNTGALRPAPVNMEHSEPAPVA